MAHPNCFRLQSSPWTSSTTSPFSALPSIRLIRVTRSSSWRFRATQCLPVNPSWHSLSIPPKRQNAHTFEVPREDHFSGEVLSYESTHLEKSAPAEEVFLLSHPVNLGQSGSPVISQSSRAVVGLVEGRWLRSSGFSVAKSSSKTTPTPGAAVPIRYAIALLQRQSISWHTPQSSPSSSPAH